jgi:hypothetical protein
MYKVTETSDFSEFMPAVPIAPVPTPVVGHTWRRQARRREGGGGPKEGEGGKGERAGEQAGKRVQCNISVSEALLCDRPPQPPAHAPRVRAATLRGAARPPAPPLWAMTGAGRARARQATQHRAGPCQPLRHTRPQSCRAAP